jgi:hypothetical protein
MNVAQVTVDRSRARELFRAHKKHQHYSEPIDQEIQRSYQLIAQGRTVIQAFESIRQAGLNAEGLPKLAICRADARECHWRTFSGYGEFLADERWSSSRMQASKRMHLDWTDIASNSKEGKARLPLIPLHLRPQRGLANYHILWEAEWTPVPPVDPFLLRRIGRGDLWLVVAAWELTAVERAALSTRMSG